MAVATCIGYQVILGQWATLDLRGAPVSTVVRWGDVNLEGKIKQSTSWRLFPVSDESSQRRMGASITYDLMDPWEFIVLFALCLDFPTPW
jgi:hypothetical protein